ncbi:MAG: prepilin-type N-terminal cleavage/methylation domain-containing protein [Candidatus Omnitrophota bacterium]
MKRNQGGLSLLEVLVAIFIMVVAVGALASLYPGIFWGIAQDTQSLKSWEICQNGMEYLKNSDFLNFLLPAAYIPGEENPRRNSFPEESEIVPEGEDISGVYYVERMRDADDNVLSDLVKVEVVVCYKSGNTIIGEDRNLNGALDSQEDTNSDGKINSETQLSTLIMRH